MLVGIAHGENRHALAPDPGQDVPGQPGHGVRFHHVEGDQGVSLEEFADAHGPEHLRFPDLHLGIPGRSEGPVSHVQQPRDAGERTRELVPPVGDALEFAGEAQIRFVLFLDRHDLGVGVRAEFDVLGTDLPRFILLGRQFQKIDHSLLVGLTDFLRNLRRIGRATTDEALGYGPQEAGQQTTPPETLLALERSDDLGLDRQADGQSGFIHRAALPPDPVGGDLPSVVRLQVDVDVRDALGVAAAHELEGAALVGHDGDATALLVHDHLEGLGSHVVQDHSQE